MTDMVKVRPGTFELPEAEYQRFRIACIYAGLTQPQAVQEAILQWTARREELVAQKEA